MTSKHIVDADGNLILLDHVMVFEQHTHEHNALFYSRIIAKMRDGSQEYIFSQSYPTKVERDSIHARAWRMITSIMGHSAADFSQPIRARKR